jgi:hypothetical protein
MISFGLDKIFKRRTPVWKPFRAPQQQAEKL